MGNCIPFLRLTREKYRENLETPSQKPEGFQLVSEEYISSLTLLSDDNFAIGQENLISTFSDQANLTYWPCEERVRSMCTASSLIFTGGKSIELYTSLGKLLGRLSGHERPVNSMCFNNNLLLSGSSDWSVRLWDIPTQRQLEKSTINWNVVTSIRWLDENTAVQTSEDLKLRIWDVRQRKLGEASAISVGDNFATCCDVRENMIATGHRGFSGNGCEVKVWDIRGKSVVFSTKEHEQPVEAVKFCGDGVVSCGKDGKIVRYGGDGGVCESWTHSSGKPFIAMENFKGGLILANIEPRIMMFSVNPLSVRV